MRSKPSPHERRVYRQAIHRRATALAELTADGVREIDMVTLTAARSLLMAVIAYDSDGLRDEFFRWVAQSVREQHGICFCGDGPIESGEGLCLACLETVRDAAVN